MKEELKARWREVFNTPPPARTRSDFLHGHLSWAAQAKAYGGLTRKATNQLKHLMIQLRQGNDFTPENALLIKQGTKLIREYRGVKHEVTTTDTGFYYAGKDYKSLSMIAREITGTRWNGKAFFGVAKK